MQWILDEAYATGRPTNEVAMRIIISSFIGVSTSAAVSCPIICRATS